MPDRMSQPLKMKRIGARIPGTPPILGTWTYTHSTDATAYERFTPDGHMVLLVEMQVNQGIYNVSLGGVLVEFPSGSLTFVRKSEVLVTTMEGKPVTFRRAPE
jgi:hypothetical protein